MPSGNEIAGQIAYLKATIRQTLRGLVCSDR